MAKKRTRPRGGSGQSSSGRNGRPSSGGRRRRGYRSGQNGRRNQPDDFDLTEVDESELTEYSGLLEMHPNGYGFLRSPSNNYSRERTDPFVPGTMIEKFSLRPGLMIKGLV